MRTKQRKVCSTGDAYLLSTLKTERRFYGMYCGQTRTDRNNLPMLSGRNKRRDSLFFLSDFFCFRCGYRSTVPRGSKRRKNSRLKHLFSPTPMRQFFLPPLTSALCFAKNASFTVPSSFATAENGKKIKNSEVKTNEKSSLQHFQIQ